ARSPAWRLYSGQHPLHRRQRKPQDSNTSTKKLSGGAHLNSIIDSGIQGVRPLFRAYRCAPLQWLFPLPCFFVPCRGREVLFQFGACSTRSVAWRIALDSPTFFERPAIDSVESEFIEEMSDGSLSVRIITEDRQCAAIL